jgi:hypothetical protein
MRRHEVFLVITDFSLPSHFNYYCIRAQYFGPKHDFPSYKFEVSLGGVCKHNAEFEGCSDTKDGKIIGGGLHVHISACFFNDFCQNRLPIYKRNFSIKISKKSSAAGDCSRVNDDLN